jgi:DNA-binding GntR family transcriptional regulator
VSIIDNRYEASGPDASEPDDAAPGEHNAQPIERRVFRDEIREKLIDGILTGRLRPGTRIVETKLAQQFGVSQAPVREALRDLALYGFVVNSPFRGTRVRRITPEELLEIYPIRAALEGVAAAAAAARIDEATLNQLEDLIATMRDAAARNDQWAQVNADGAFHHTIITAAGNRMLEHVWQTMRLSVTTCVTHSLTHRSLHEITERHVPVLEALRSRDPVKAEAAIRRHIEEPGEWIRAAASATATANAEPSEGEPPE